MVKPGYGGWWVEGDRGAWQAENMRGRDVGQPQQVEAGTSCPGLGPHCSHCPPRHRHPLRKGPSLPDHAQAA